MWGALGFFVIGVVLVALGADSVVRGIAGLARRLGIAAFAVGVIVALVGGSIPDFAINIDAVAHGHGALALGNLIGSSIMNLGLGLGLAAIVRPIDGRIPALRPLAVGLLASGIVLLAMAHNGTFGYLDGAVLLVGFLVLVVLVLRHAPTRSDPSARALIEAEGDTRTHLGLNLLRLIVGVALLVYGARMAVSEAVFLAGVWQVSPLFLGLTLMAIGTSLPQLALIIAGAARGHGDAVLVGVIGSNLVNLLLVLGATALVAPYPVVTSLVWLEIPALIAFSAALYPLLRGDFRISRGEGAALLIAFIALFAFQIYRVASI